MAYLFSFNGRFGRLQWWSIQLIIGVVLVAFVFAIGGSLVSLGDEAAAAFTSQHAGTFMVSILILCAFCAWINIAATVKRYHDRDKSGFWYMVVFIPFIGGIWQFVECGFLSGTSGGNSYGSRQSFDASLFDDKELADPSQRHVRAQREGERKIEPAKPAPRGTRPSSGFGRTQPAGFGKRGL